MSLIQRKMLAMVCRQGLLMLSGALITRGVLTQEDWGLLSQYVDPEMLVGFLAAAVTVYSGAKVKQRDQAVAEKALATTNPNLTLEQVERSVPPAFPRLSTGNR